MGTRVKVNECDPKRPRMDTDTSRDIEQGEGGSQEDSSIAEVSRSVGAEDRVEDQRLQLSTEPVCQPESYTGSDCSGDQSDCQC